MAGCFGLTLSGTMERMNLMTKRDDTGSENDAFFLEYGLRSSKLTDIIGDRYKSYHSPSSSPLLARKKPRFTERSNSCPVKMGSYTVVPEWQPHLFARVFTSTSDKHTDIDSDSIAENRSILKSGIKSWRLKSRTRHIHFKPEVIMIQLDENGDYENTEYGELSFEPKPTRLSCRHKRRQVLVDRSNVSSSKVYETDPAHCVITKSGGATVAHPQTDLYNDTLERFQRRRLSPPPQDSTSKLSLNPTVTYNSDENGVTKLKMLFKIGKGYNQDEIVVKASTGGSKIRLVATKLEEQGDGTHDLQELNEVYPLPLNVDPFAISARLDRSGYLTVEAPLVEPVSNTIVL